MPTILPEDTGAGSAVTLRWISGSDGGKAEKGALLRWRESSRGRWVYAYYRGTEGRSLTFSDTAQGPITRWRVALPNPAQVAVIR